MAPKEFAAASAEKKPDYVFVTFLASQRKDIGDPWQVYVRPYDWIESWDCLSALYVHVFAEAGEGARKYAEEIERMLAGKPYRLISVVMQGETIDSPAKVEFYRRKGDGYARS